MYLLEEDLENIIMDSDHWGIYERGLTLDFPYKKLRQLRIGNYGIADLVWIYRHQSKLCVTGLELKKELITVDAFMQAVRYVKGIKQYLEKRGKDLSQYTFSIVLIGKKNDVGDVIFLPDVFDQTIKITQFEYLYDVYGVRFKELKNYSLTDTGFKI